MAMGRLQVLVFGFLGNGEAAVGEGVRLGAGLKALRARFGGSLGGR